MYKLKWKPVWINVELALDIWADVTAITYSQGSCCQQRQLKGPNTACTSSQVCYKYARAAWLSWLWRREEKKRPHDNKKNRSRGILPTPLWRSGFAPLVADLHRCWKVQFHMCMATSLHLPFMLGLCCFIRQLNQLADLAEKTPLLQLLPPAGLGEVLWVTAWPHKRQCYHKGVSSDARQGERENRSFWKSTFSNWLKIFVQPRSWIWTRHRYVAVNWHIKLNAKPRRL